MDDDVGSIGKIKKVGLSLTFVLTRVKGAPWFIQIAHIVV